MLRLGAKLVSAAQETRFRNLVCAFLIGPWFAAFLYAAVVKPSEEAIRNLERPFVVSTIGLAVGVLLGSEKKPEPGEPPNG